MLRRGIEQIAAAGADLVLMDLQYAPRVLARPAHALMEQVIADTAERDHVALFRRFAMMRYWHSEPAAVATVGADGLHMNDAGQGDEHGDREVAGRSGPTGGVVQLAGLGFGERDQLLHGRGRQLWIHHQQVLHQRDQRNRLEVPDRVVIQLRGDHRRKRMRGHRAREQRVAVRRRVGGGFRSDLAAGATAVVDHDRRVEDGGHLRGNDADDGVIGAAGRIGRDHPDRPVGIALRGRSLHQRRQAEQKRKPG